MQEKEIKLTKEQFLTLAKMVYAGNWLLNAARVEREERHKQYDEMQDLIIEKYAKDFGYPDLTKVDDNFEEKIYTMIEEDLDFYNDDTFWQELVDKLGTRDFYNKYSQEEIMKMTKEERFNKLMDIEDIYGEEFNNNGIDNLVIKIKNNKYDDLI